MNQIVNAAPMVIDYGTQDLSTVQLPREPEAIPQHLPKVFLFAEKGPQEPQLVSGVELINTFGARTFDLQDIFANHATVFANLINAQGNALMLQRVIPDDAGPEANLVAWLDVLPTTVDLYERNTDGSIKTDNLGDPILDGTTTGYKIKWVVDFKTTDLQMADFGAATIKPGDQTDTLTSTQSQRYPIFELKVSSKGAAGNLSGFRLWAPTIKNQPIMPTKLMNEAKAYPYFISVIRKPDTLTSPKVVSNIFGENKMMVTFKQNTVDPLTEQRLNIEETFINGYQNLTDLRYPKQYGDFSDLVVHNDNIETLLGLFHTSEVSHIDEFSDITASAETKHLFNFVNGVSSYNVPYHSVVFVDNVDSVRFSDITNIYTAGGSDGTMTDAIFAQLVSAQMQRYLDLNDEFQENAVNVESIIYDSGFPMETKYDLCNFIAQRKDTFVVLATHDVNDRILNASEEHSIAVALRTRAQMFPESDYFGTPVMRCMIVGRSGKLRNSKYTKDLPLTAEVAIKSAKYMGASNGRWKNGSHFDGSPGSIVENMYDINIKWVPTAVRNRNWDAGLNWVQAYDRRSFFFPALKTVYDDDTSVLNSYFTALAIGQLNKVAHAVWRQFSGVSHLTNGQMVERVNNAVIERTNNRFDNRFVIQPEAFFTDMDLMRGFSWTLPIKIYAANMKTVMTTYVKAFRLDDLA